MAIPTPSFFKIRLSILIIGFVVVCFLIGVVKDAFAESYTILNSPCKKIVAVYQFDNAIWASENIAWQIGADGYLNRGFSIIRSGYTRPGKNIHVTKYYWDGTAWQSGGNSTTTVDNDIYLAAMPRPDHEIVITNIPYSTESSDDVWIATQTCDTSCPNGEIRDSSTGQCIDPCQSEINEAETTCGESGYQWINEEQCLWACKPDCGALLSGLQLECGGSDYVDEWDDTTCTGTCKCDNEAAGEVTYGALKQFCGSAAKTDYDVTLCRGRCKDCSIEYQQLEMVCGLNGLIIRDFDFTTCNGSCSDDCSDEYQLLEQECLPSKIINWNEKTCSGECEKDCTEQYNELEDKCGIAGITSFNNGTCEGKCNDCGAREASCKKKCAGQTITYECNEFSLPNGYITGIEDGNCSCTPPNLQWGNQSNSITPGSYGGTVKQNPDGSYTETLANGNTFTYSADGTKITARKTDGTVLQRTTNSDGSISYYTQDEDGNYTKRTSMQVDGMETWTEQKGTVSIPNNPPPSNPDGSNQFFDVIADNTNPSQSNSGTIQTGTTTNAAGDTVQSAGTSGDFEGITSLLSDISSGVYSQESISTSYLSPEHSFETRTNDFLTSMRSTGLFSIPNTLSHSIPSGGTSTLTISTGTTFGGDHTIDFNWLSAGLTTLKYLFQIAGMVLAIRIVTLKR